MFFTPERTSGFFCGMTKRSGILARVLRGTPRNLARLARALRRGELVAVPTETVYGLAANAFDARACRAIFRAKRRPASDPLIVHIHALKQLPTLACVNDAALKLASAFWPGPLTLVLPKTPAVPKVVTANRGSVAVRMPAHVLLRRLLRLADVPLAAPSANPFGYVSPTTAAHVRDGLGHEIPFILDGGPCSIGVESTIVDLRHPSRPRLLRPGAIARSDLERVLNRKVGMLKRSGRSSTARAQLAPGLLPRHYSPRTPLVLHAEAMRPCAGNEAFVFLRRPEQRAKNIFWLDARGNLRGVARRLFSMLRSLDTRGFTCIHVQCPRGDDGLAAALNDRLRRAAAR